MQDYLSTHFLDQSIISMIFKNKYYAAGFESLTFEIFSYLRKISWNQIAPKTISKSLSRFFFQVRPNSRFSTIFGKNFVKATGEKKVTKKHQFHEKSIFMNFHSSE